VSTLSELVAARELLTNLTLRDLRGRYRRSALGWLWSLVNPLATMVIFSVVFRLFLRIPPEVGTPSRLENFPLFLLTGLLFWNFFSVGVSSSMSLLLANANLVKKVYFPREVIVLAGVSSALVTLLIEVGVLTVALLLVGNFVVPWLPVVVFFALVLAAFTTGVALVLSVVNVYFRDVEYLTSIVLQLLFYCAPIVYPLALVPERAVLFGSEVPVRSIYLLNPLVRFVEIFRDCLYHLRLPGLRESVYVVVVSGLILAVGLAVFARMQTRLAEEL
jgi:lipopolysaccharide transport system permease protein